MEEEEKIYVATKPISGKQDAAGIGFITLPSGYDEEQYIEHCYRAGTVSILIENGGILNDVLIAKHALNEIDFPTSTSTLGSQVIWVSQPRRQRPIIIGHINKADEFVSYSKNKSSLRRATGGSVYEVIVDSKKGVVIINSNSATQTGGDIYILSTNKTKSTKFNIQVGGDINVLSNNFFIENSGEFNIKIKDLDIDSNVAEIGYIKGEGLSILDEFGNKGIFNQENIQFQPASKFNVGEGNEPAMLSETFKDIFNDFSDAISKLASYCAAITVNTPMGPSSVPNNAGQFTQISNDINLLKDKYVNFQSTINFTD